MHVDSQGHGLSRLNAVEINGAWVFVKWRWQGQLATCWIVSLEKSLLLSYGGGVVICRPYIFLDFGDYVFKEAVNQKLGRLVLYLYTILANCRGIMISGLFLGLIN